MSNTIELTTGRKLTFGHASTYDFIMEATGEDPLQWLKSKLGMFEKNDSGEMVKWEYKGNRNFIAVALYSGINTFARQNDKSGRITIEEATDLVYDIDFDDRNKIIEALITSIVSKISQNGQGEPHGQQAVS